jgi:hypothetical protein
MSECTARKRLRKATAAERRKLGLGKGATVEEVNLRDLNLAPEHREHFTTMVKAKVAELDELIGRWYRHRGECGDPDCDCGGNYLIEEAEKMCGPVLAVKQIFGETIIDRYPHFARLVKEFGPDAYAALSARASNRHHA